MAMPGRNCSSGHWVELFYSSDFCQDMEEAFVLLTFILGLLNIKDNNFDTLLSQHLHN
jgi:hypothetical protein